MTIILAAKLTVFKCGVFHYSDRILSRPLPSFSLVSPSPSPGLLFDFNELIHDCDVTSSPSPPFLTAPSSPPQYLRVARKTSTSFTLTWQPPPLSQQNGAIQFYTLTVQEQGTNATLLEFTTNDTNLTIRPLHPYYYYESNVRAENILPGPFSEVIRIQLDEDGKSCGFFHVA